ncbi:ABC transporter substrate-binding protein [Pseudoalteromonas luteoviolacea]|uniref:ABC transporter substrate-binding protein n=1 Tax=Pseudoalteromonas luteoviolacea NCIMB 1942 TaxID=1365253 RepID=A0A167A4B0_9GAMM|nr:ABC transporter substrate binding protein [Pseudoalteromonas luteoviolacea]KZN44970.1 hypothetical protein N482_02925 [Pseudoalteromonas luteoviolacea NCIMB 1942]KZW99148.1 hypothetical protein JL49_18855 [Pseudoalteromonas luteoviolacea]
MNLVTYFLYVFALLTYSLANAQSKKVLIIETLPVPIVTTHTQYISAELSRLNMDIKLEIYNGDGQSERIANHISKKLNCNCIDLVITNGTLASKIGKRVLKGKSIPMVFVTVADPHGAGLVPSKDSTDLNFIAGSIYSVKRGTKLEIANQLLKGKQTDIGIVATTYPSALTDIAKLESISNKYKNINLVKRVVDYKDTNDVELTDTYLQAKNAVVSIQPEVDFYWSVNGPFSEKQSFVPETSKIKPVLYGANVNSVMQGALFTVIPDVQSAAEQVAQIVKAIFSGVSPHSIAVKPAPRSTVAFNVKTATRLGIVIPYDLLSIAGDNIFQ